jgi:hypothetical protein
MQPRIINLHELVYTPHSEKIHLINPQFSLLNFYDDLALFSNNTYFNWKNTGFD